MNAIGYIRVSTDEQALSGLGLEAQRAAVQAKAEYLGWDIGHWAVDDGYSAREGAVRPAWDHALELLAAGVHGALVALRFDRISRSTFDSAAMLRELETHGWELVLVDGQVDTTTAVGRMFFRQQANMAEYERDLISERTRAALAAKRARGERLGRERVIAPELEALIVRLARGNTYAQVVDVLQSRGIPSPSGRDRWAKSTIGAIVKRS
jgi:DNA invertase Pin-like site-specific DNA recombinase